MEEQEHRNILPKGFWLHEYQIDSVLGKPGGFGITYLATDTNLHQSVAIKEYLPTEFAVREGRSTVCVRSTSDKEAFEWGLKCFAEEAQNLAKFKHSNIVRVLRFFKENGTAYMVMEYQEGESLAEYLKRTKTLPEEDLLLIALPLLDGLKAVHKAGLLHRDIKPNNIYIRHDKSPVLLDFGSARYAVGQRSRSVTSIVSPGYAPLEQYDNDIGEQGPWTDVYALGAVMYCAIYGEPPPAATRRASQAMKDQDPLIPAAKVGQNKYRNNLLIAIDWALEINKENRPQNIEEWRKAFAPELNPSHAFSAHGARNNTGKTPGLKLSIFTGIMVTLLWITTVSVFFYFYNELTHEKDELTREKESCLHKKANLDKRLKEKEKSYDEIYKNYEMTQAIIENIRYVEKVDQTTSKYYDVTRVKPNDALVIRKLPGPNQEPTLASIPFQGRCVRYIGDKRVVDTFLWVKIRYDTHEGWVNSHHLAPVNDNKQCEAKESTPPDDKQQESKTLDKH